ncbi:hypothetical protein RUM43_009963 [Polyplax serrata]|uniref:SEFIR domain-containing protein n=1 Tax=Polyplax serrata TaxID=468196 RepID=A0AAN8P3D2_POLSC
MIDPDTGKLQIRFQSLPKSCDFEAYVIELEIYDEGAAYEEALMCSTGNTSWVTHSRKFADNTICSNCTSDNCMQEHVAHFNYVYQGIYRLKITPYVNGNTRQAQRSYRLHINSTATNYVKKEFSGVHLNVSLQYRSASRELNLGIPLLIEHPDAVKIEVKYSSAYTDLYGITVYGNVNKTDIHCDDDDKTRQPSCQMDKKGLECTFYNATHGLYIVYVSFIDDRCATGTVWTNSHPDSCFWVIKKEVAPDTTVTDALMPPRDSVPSHVLYTSILIIILVGAIIASLIAKRICKRKRDLSNGIVGKATENTRKTNTEHTYNFNNGYSNRFNFGQFLTMTEKPRPEVLLVYAREGQPFMELMSCFRRVLSKIFKCQVYDCFDGDLWNEVSLDPKGWIHTLIVEREAKVIIVSSAAGAAQHKSLLDNAYTNSNENPHPFDGLYLYAIRIVRDGLKEDSYKNLFVISFDGITESNHLLEYLNPFTRFVLPKHLYKLFEHLHDSEYLRNVDINRLEEKQEVRQLRLQLDHLKNLKLLGNR